MATTRAHLNQEEYQALRSHLLKHKAYPYNYSINRAITAGNFPTADASGTVKSYSLLFKPTVETGIVSLASNLIIRPETTFGLMGIQLSFKSTLTFADNPTLLKPADEGTEAYNIIVNGGAINDFQVFFPLNYYVEANQTLYIHVYADNTTVAAATSTMIGKIVLGTFPLTN